MTKFQETESELLNGPTRTDSYWRYVKLITLALLAIAEAIREHR